MSGQHAPLRRSIRAPSLSYHSPCVMNILRRYLKFFVPVASFVFIFIAINTYQYLKVKQTISTSLITTAGKAELTEMRSFFTKVKSQLNIVKDWGKNGVLDIKDTADLNKKFMPFFSHQEYFSGVLLANSAGEEYLLIKESSALVSRRTTQTNNGSVFEFTQWASPEEAVKKWKESTIYDPRNRPWFRGDTTGNGMFLSGVYSFHHTQKPGITASIAWDSGNTHLHTHVFAIDFLLDDIQALMDSVNTTTSTVLFLVNAQTGAHILGNSSPTSTAPLAHTVHDPTVIPQIITTWKKEGSPRAQAIHHHAANKNWLASFQPLFPGDDNTWIGVLATEQALLGELDRKLFTIDLFDVGIALTAALVLSLVLWQTGLLSRASSTSSPVQRFMAYLAAGEGPGVEYKSTLRKNIRTGKQGKEIELAWLKAVVAFLNSKGGAVLIGVDDNGTLQGLDADEFENEDKLLLHVKNLVNQHIGAEFSALISTNLVTMENNRALMIEVHAAETPVFLRIGKNEEFYIRSGPSSMRLSPSQMVDFVLRHYGKGKNKKRDQSSHQSNG